MRGVDPPTVDTRRGALVLSLDVEMHWGVFDVQRADGPYRPALLGEREAVPRLLELFGEHGISATWAVVGLLMARSRREAREVAPASPPRYADPALSAYGVKVGEGEADDPLHYAPSVVERIARAPGQELATHTFSHYYCLEPGQTREDFAADLRAAGALFARWGVPMRSIVFPRNQRDPSYDAVLREAGIVAYRGTQRGWMNRPVALRDETRLLRAARRLDSLLPLTGGHTYGWDQLGRGAAPYDVPASFFLRPEFDPLSLARVTRAMREAARRERVVHLWWHPHNFGVNLEHKLSRLRALLAVHRECVERWGMQSLTMAAAADAASRVHAR